MTWSLLSLVPLGLLTGLLSGVLGIGGGLNLAFYDPKLVSSVEGVDPSDELRAFAEAAPRPEGLNVTIAKGTAEALPFADGSFDTVVCTFTLCSVQDPAAALAEASPRAVIKSITASAWVRSILPLRKARRVNSPGGALAAPDTKTARNTPWATTTPPCPLISTTFSPV
jgi:SAM-dependent methyltransferase